MANGLDAGDSVKGSDTFKWFRGERATTSPGERDVRISDLVAYLNDSDVLSAVGGAGGASADELARIAFLEKNLGLNTLRDTISEGWSIVEMVDGFADEYEDETGVNTGSSTGQAYIAAGDYYNIAPSGSDFEVLVQGENTASSSTDWSAGSQAANLDSTGNNTMTVVGSVVNSTTQKKFDNASVRFPGSGSYLHTPTASSWADLGNLATATWTAEAWIYLDTTTGFQNFMGAYETNSAWYFGQNGGKIRFIYNVSGVTAEEETGTSLSATTWHHVAAVLDSGTLRLYVDGTQVHSASITGTNAAAAGDLVFGALTKSTTHPFSGYMEEMGIDPSSARYPNGTTFTPEIAPYNTSAGGNMVLLGAAQSAQAVPSNARMVILHDPIDAVTLNTDCTLEISRDGGSTYTTFTLTKEADYDSDIQILTTDDLDISGQPSGSSVVYRFSTVNAKQQRIHGVYGQWR